MNQEEDNHTVNRNFWKAEEENLLKQWADKAQCYQWMHARSHNIYSRKNALFTIPVIIISTITGTANFAQDRFSDDIKTYVVISIGTLSIIAGIITTVYQFLKIAELNEGHRVSTLSWGKFYRNIKTELSRHPLDRMPPLEMIKISRDEYDRLVELSPFMPMKVINEFNSKFKQNLDLTKPEICDELNSTSVFTLKEEERKKLIEELQHNNKIVEDPKKTKQKEIIRKRINEKTEKFRQTFRNLNGRFPTESEIKNHMSKFLQDEDVISNDGNLLSKSVSPESPSSNNIECNEISFDMEDIKKITKPINVNIENTITEVSTDGELKEEHEEETTKENKKII